MEDISKKHRQNQWRRQLSNTIKQPDKEDKNNHANHKACAWLPWG
jgi:hypothetical protein